VALFDDSTTIPPASSDRAPRRALPRRTLVGIWSLAVALLALFVLTVLPTQYVIQRQGPVYNTLGTARDAQGEQVPLISISGATTYPTEGALDLLTIEVVGNRERTPSWFELAAAWADPAKAVVPLEAVFPGGQSTEERNELVGAMMIDSQKEATAAALIELGHDVSPTVRVYAVGEDSAARGVLEPDDVIVAAEGTPVTVTEELREVINAGAGAPVELTIERDGERRTVELTPRQGEVNGQTLWLIGVTTTPDYDFPFEVTIQLNNVGGSSAGMMFALGIIDTLTPGALNGGEHVAGTGTIDAAGTVGVIGGIRQKMHGAKDAGADYFLAPVGNCDEVVGHIPDGLRVFAVETLDDALEVMASVRGEGEDAIDALPTCTR